MLGGEPSSTVTMICSAGVAEETGPDAGQTRELPRRHRQVRECEADDHRREAVSGGTAGKHFYDGKHSFGEHFIVFN